MKTKQHSKQKYEYYSVVVNPKPLLGQYSNGTYIATDTVYNHKQDMAAQITTTLLHYAEMGWRLKSDVTIDGEFILIFEKPCDDYVEYNAELLNYIKGE